jgi:hypothetical protein
MKGKKMTQQIVKDLDKGPLTMTKEEKDNMTMQMEHDRDWEKVKGVFHYMEVQGGKLPVTRRKYKQDEPYHREFVDGEICSVPFFVAQHLNSSGRVPIYADKVSENGQTLSKVSYWTRRWSFDPIDFVDVGQYSESQIIKP